MATQQQQGQPWPGVDEEDEGKRVNGSTGHTPHTQRADETREPSKSATPSSPLTPDPQVAPPTITAGNENILHKNYTDEGDGLGSVTHPAGEGSNLGMVDVGEMARKRKWAAMRFTPREMDEMESSTLGWVYTLRCSWRSFKGLIERWNGD